MAKARLLILGTGSMAQGHATAFSAIPGCAVVACADVDLDRAQAFATRNRIEKAYGSLESAIAAGGFNCAANVTPDAHHHPTTMKLLKAGIHVFCEKPLATDARLAMQMAECAEKTGLVNMVNFTYRNSPALAKARALVDAGRIGELRHVSASYRQSWLTAKNWGNWRSEPRWLWRLSQKHGSAGVLGDVGVHILDMATFCAGEGIRSVDARLVTFDKAEGGRIGEYDLDANDSYAATVRFAGGALGVVHASRFATGHANDLAVELHGTLGALKIETDGHQSRLQICAGRDIDSQTWRNVRLPRVRTTYQLFIDSVRNGRNHQPDFLRAAEIQKLVDASFKSDKTGKSVSID